MPAIARSAQTSSGPETSTIGAGCGDAPGDLRDRRARPRPRERVARSSPCAQPTQRLPTSPPRSRHTSSSDAVRQSGDEPLVVGARDARARCPSSSVEDLVRAGDRRSLSAPTVTSATAGSASAYRRGILVGAAVVCDLHDRRTAARDARMPRARAAATPTGRRGTATSGCRRPRTSSDDARVVACRERATPGGRPEHAPLRARRAFRCMPAWAVDGPRTAGLESRDEQSRIGGRRGGPCSDGVDPPDDGIDARRRGRDRSG